MADLFHINYIFALFAVSLRKRDAGIVTKKHFRGRLFAFIVEKNHYRNSEQSAPGDAGLIRFGFHSCLCAPAPLSTFVNMERR